MWCLLKTCLPSFCSKKDSWSVLPEDLKKQVTDYLTPKEKARLSMTSKSNYAFIKSTTHIHWLQFDPLKSVASRAVQIFVFFDEQQKHSYMFQFYQSGKNIGLKVVENQREDEAKTRFVSKCNYREMASKCLEGWMNGTTINALDVRGEFIGTMPQNLKVNTISVTDRYSKPGSVVSAWLDSLADKDVNLMIMSDHFGSFLTHKQFSNPRNTCKLTGFDGITEEGILAINCRQIQLQNVKNEKTFNVFLEKWSSGNCSDSFDWFIAVHLCRSFQLEILLKDHNKKALDKRMFIEYDNHETDEPMEYFLLQNSSGQYAVFSWMHGFARLLVISPSLVEQIPQLKKYLQPPE